MEKYFNELAKDIITKEDLIFIIEEIELVQKLVFTETGTPVSERAKGRISQSLQKYLQDFERKKLISNIPEKNQLFFNQLKQYLKSFPQMRIQIAFRPDREFLRKISLWIEKEFKQKIILDLILNSRIIGGAIIEYGGKYLDYSLAKAIERELKRFI